MVGFADRSCLDALYGSGAADAISAARVLVVGAGGVGCELVKNLGSAGFSRITLIDLDTIDVSNLNRQFLFRRSHVGRAKAVVAARAVERMVEGIDVEGLVGNIREPRFDVEFFRGFGVVCNALDNLEARRHVNRMCLAAETTLIESGSTGYNGQVTVIRKGKECYDCFPKPAPKSYAVCTIRSTPEKPVHCVVWAKHLWELIFGEEDESNVLRDLDGGGAGGDQSTRREKSPHHIVGGTANDVDENTEDAAISNGCAPVEVSKQRHKRVRFESGESSEMFANRVCQRVFKDDIEQQAAMKTLWEKRPPPEPYDVVRAADELPRNLDQIDLLEARVWSREECAAIFKQVLKRVVDSRVHDIGSLIFDKDDHDALAFVVAASNLRCATYGISLQSPFAVKGIAGNIIHAIATTNAMVAGLIVLEAIKVVTNKGELHDSLTTFVRKIPTGNLGRRRSLLCTEPICDPNPNCYVCSKGLLRLSIDVETADLGMVVESICKKSLGAREPTISVKTGDFFNTLFETGEGLEDDEVEMYQSNLSKTLNDLRVESGSQLDVDDHTQNFQCVLLVTCVPNIGIELTPNKRFELAGQIPAVKEPGIAANVAQEPSSQDRSGEESDVVEEVPVPGRRKRALESDSEDVAQWKKVKVALHNEEGDDIVEILD